MQQHSLRQTAKQYCNNNRRGKPQSRKFRNYVIKKMTHDLYVTGNPPTQWQLMSDTQLQQLVAHWQKQRLKSATMLNHLTIIRRFLRDMGNNTITLSNQDLGITRPHKTQRKSPIDCDFWQIVDEPIARVMLAIQVYFGLTHSETIRLKPFIHIQPAHLWLTREMTFNSEDRVIPLRHPTQETILSSLAQLTNGPYNLQQTFKASIIKLSMHKGLDQLNLTGTTSWRYLYARWLQQQLAGKLSAYKLNWLIMDEMGLKSRTSLWRYLNE